MTKTGCHELPGQALKGLNGGSLQKIGRRAATGGEGISSIPRFTSHHSRLLRLAVSAAVPNCCHSGLSGIFPKKDSRRALLAGMTAKNIQATDALRPLPRGLLRFTFHRFILGSFMVVLPVVMVLLLFTSSRAGAVTINEYWTYSGYPEYIAAGPDGNLWFTEIASNKIGRVTPAGVVTEFAVPTANSYPAGIAAGPDGNLWFAENGGNKIGKITTDGAFAEYAIPTTNSGPWGITKGPDGNLWFTEYTGNKIGQVTTAGVFTEFVVFTGGSGPTEIASGPDGNLWFTENTGNRIGKITTSGAFTEYVIPTASSQPWGITTGPDGNIWFTENAGSKIGQLVVGTGQIAEFPIYPDKKGEPTGITVGSDGNLWFADYFYGNIGQVTGINTTVAINVFPVPSSFSEPVGLVTGPDGNLWFAELNAGKIGQLLVVTSGPSHTVTPSAGPNGGISPNTPQTVNYGSSVSFTMTPDTGYHVSSVTGCGGSLSGNTFTTGAITADCTVSASFSVNTYSVTPWAGLNGSISPDTAQIVDYNGTVQFTVIPDAGYAISSVTGCGGTLAGYTYTTAPVTTSCTVTASFSLMPPTADFSAVPLAGPAPLTVDFTDSSSNNPTSWSWTFGDGGASTLQNPVYTYQNAGTYTVSLTASNTGGSGTKTAANYITVSCPVLPVRIDRQTPLYYSSLQSALNVAASGDLIQLQAATLTEAVDLNSGAAVTLSGGYDACYTDNSGGSSTISGSLTIGSGSVTIEDVVIQ